MNANDAIEIRNKADRYEKIEKAKDGVLSAIHTLQKKQVTTLVFWAKDLKRGSGLAEAYCLRGIEDYNQMTLDYLNMLYETMTYDQSKL